MKNVKKLFNPKRPGSRRHKGNVPYHEDRKQRKQWELERLGWERLRMTI